MEHPKLLRLNNICLLSMTLDSVLFSELTMHVDCYEFIRLLVETHPLCNTEIQLLIASDGSISPAL